MAPNNFRIAAMTATLPGLPAGPKVFVILAQQELAHQREGQRQVGLAKFQSHRRRLQDRTLYVERRDLDLATSRMHVHFIVVDPKGGRRESIGHNTRLYTLTEMTRLLEGVGFHVTVVFVGFEREVYSIGTRRMIVIARKG
jgi:hypothetical protein